MKELKFDVVAMKDVPDPPMSSRCGSGRYAILYRTVKDLGLGEKSAVRVPCTGAKEMTYMKSQLRKMAKGDGLRLLSSRDAESTIAFVWFISDKS